MDEKENKSPHVSSDNFIGPRTMQQDPSQRQSYIKSKNLAERTIKGNKGFSGINLGLAQQNPETKKKYLEQYRQNQNQKPAATANIEKPVSKNSSLSPQASVSVQSSQQGHTTAGSIQPLVKGDEGRTMLHTDTANQIIATINTLWNMRGTGGIRIYRSGYNIVIDGANVETGSGGGAPAEHTHDYLKYRGRYTAGVTYQTNDVVVYDGREPDIYIQQFGAFVCIKDDTLNIEPPKGEDASNDNWATLAPTHKLEQVWGNPDGDYPDYSEDYAYMKRGKLTLYGKDADRQDGETVNPGLVLDGNSLTFAAGRNSLAFNSTYPYSADYGLTIAPIQLQVCQNGETKYLWVLGMLSDVP